MVVTDDSVFKSKVWVPEMFIKMLSKCVHKSPGDEIADRFLESSQQQTDGSFQTKSCHAGGNENVEAKTAIMGIEKNDDGLDHLKSHCAGNEEMSRSVEKNQKLPHLGLKSKRRKIGAFHAALWACILILFLCLPSAQEADLRDWQPRQQNTSMNFCEIYTSSLSQSTGPWNGSMCSSELEKIHCPKGEIRRCVRLVFGHSEDSLFACCIEKIKELKDGQCILLTQIRGYNHKVAQCYEGNIYCSPPVSTSPPTSSKSTQDPSTVNTTNPLPESLGQNTEPSKGLTTAASAFPVCCLIILAVCFIMVLCYMGHVVGYALCLAQFRFVVQRFFAQN